MPKFLTIPQADGDSLANAVIHNSNTLTGLTNGVPYICYALSNPSAAFIPQGEVIPPDPEEPLIPLRVAAAFTAFMIASGHSLLDTGIHLGNYPSTSRLLRNSVADPDSFGDEDDLYIFKDTIPGSPIWWRWGVPERNPQSVPTATRLRTAEFDYTIITESGPPPRVHLPEQLPNLIDTLDYLMRFVYNAYVNGNGGKVILWSNHPDTSGWTLPTQGADAHAANNPLWGIYGGFRECCVQYGVSYKYMMDYVNWKMSQLFPEFLNENRVYLFTYHALWVRIWDDLQAGLVPGYSTLAQLFDPDDIHPNTIAGYAATCFLETCFYKYNFTTNPNAYKQNEPTSYQGTNYPALSTAYADYCQQIAWEVANQYGPNGFGGEDETAVVFNPAIHADPMPNWTFENGAGEGGGEEPEPPEGDLPAYFMKWTAGDYEGPALTGPQPSIEGNTMHFTGTTPLTGNIPISGSAYGIMSVAVTEAVRVKSPLIIFHSNATWWQGPYFAVMWNGWLGNGKYIAEVTSEVSTEPTVHTGSDEVIIEWWFDGDTVYVSANGSVIVETVLGNPLPDFNRITLFGNISTESAPIDPNSTAILLCHDIPSTEERTAAYNWALNSR